MQISPFAQPEKSEQCGHQPKLLPVVLEHPLEQLSEIIRHQRDGPLLFLLPGRGSAAHQLLTLVPRQRHQPAGAAVMRNTDAHGRCWAGDAVREPRHRCGFHTPTRLHNRNRVQLPARSRLMPLKCIAASIVYVGRRLRSMLSK